MLQFLSDKFSSIVDRLKGAKTMSGPAFDASLQDIKQALMEADVPYDVAQQFIAGVKQELEGKQLVAGMKAEEQFEALVYNQIKQFLGGSAVAPSFQIPSSIMVMGLQGSGKTTTIAKIAHWLQEIAIKKGKKREILIASVDYYRPAALDQLEILANKVGATWYRSPETDPVRAAADILARFKAGGFEYLLFDTAGRLHVDEGMLDELVALEKIIKPTYKLLVLDGMIGQESLKVAEVFDKKVPFSGAVLTKMDSHARGGAAFAFRFMLKKPVMFLGTGEKPEDFEVFYPDRMASRILGRGDAETLFEKLEGAMRAHEVEKQKKVASGSHFTFVEFLDQMALMDKMGSLSKLMGYMPGKIKITDEQMAQGERQLKLYRAMICSMTLKERLSPRIIDGSRRVRIAKGSGTSVEEVNKLIKQFEEMKQFVKLMNNNRFGLFR